MKKITVLFLLFISISTFAQDEILLQADKDFAARNYDKALPVYLANSAKLSATQQVHVGDIYSQKEEYKDAMSWYKKAGDNNYAPAWMKIGLMYFRGRGVSADPKEAFKWVKKAADSGDPEGMANLGVLYMNGTGVKKDYDQAAEWLKKAAEKENPLGLYQLSNLYFLGNGVEANKAKGLELLQAAADKGYTTALFNMGVFHTKGLYVEKDFTKAAQYFRKAADKNNAASMFELGKLYLKGNGVAQNVNEALDLFKGAAQRKYEGADYYVGIIEKALATPEPEMVRVDGGTFTMGKDVPDYDMSYEPAHKVTLSTYYIGKYEVSVAEYRAFCVLTGRDLPKAPVSYGQAQKEWTDKHPAGEISWNDAVAYCDWLSKKTGKTYRLPTEAEWEFAARGGNSSRGYKYSGSNTQDEVAWTENNSKYSSQIVGSKKPNELGIYDMSGNLSEWCSDFYVEGYPAGPLTNPKGPANSDRKVIRGGNYNDRPGVTFGDETTYRSSSKEIKERYNVRGFRVVRE